MGKFIKKIYKKKLILIALFPSLIGLIVFYIAPLFILLLYSLWDGPITKKFVGFGNYIEIFNSESFWLAMGNTVIFSAVAVPLVVVISLVLASLLINTSRIGNLLYSSVLSPLVIPVASVSMVYIAFFDDKGWINGILNSFGKNSIMWLESKWAFLVVVLLFIWKNTGINMIMFMAALSGIPSEYIEVARLDTSSKFTIFRKVKFRQIVPTIVFVTILSTISSFKIFREVYVLTGKYPSDSSYYFQHYVNNMLDKLNYSLVSAATMVLLLLISIMIILLIVLERHFGKDMEEL